MSRGGERVEHRGIVGLRCGKFPDRVNGAVFVFRHGSTLIDSGPSNQWPAVRAFAGEAPLELVVASHHHEDHAGNLARLKSELGVSVLAPEESLEILADGFHVPAYRRHVWGPSPEPVEAEPLPERLEIPSGDILEPVLLPGHSHDMTCLLDRRRGVLFSADLYVASKLRYLRYDEDLPLHVDSLRRALELDFDTLLCSHRGVLTDGKELLRRKIDYLESLAERTAPLAGKGLSARQITRRLVGREDLVFYVSRGQYSKIHLIRGCLGLAGAASS